MEVPHVQVLFTIRMKNYDTMGTPAARTAVHAPVLTTRLSGCQQLRMVVCRPAGSLTNFDRRGTDDHGRSLVQLTAAGVVTTDVSQTESVRPSTAQYRRLQSVNRPRHVTRSAGSGISRECCPAGNARGQSRDSRDGTDPYCWHYQYCDIELRRSVNRN